MLSEKNFEIDQKMIEQMIEAITGYLKWQNNTVGIIYNHELVGFINPGLNAAVKKLSKGKNSWSADEYKSFLSDRIISRNRSDIERILSRLKLCGYDAIKIAEKTCAFNPKDSFWIASSESDRLEDKITEFFFNVCEISLNEGVKKNFGISNGKYGIFKNRLGAGTDIESEIACYKLGTLFGVNICPVWRVSKDVIFSEFIYDFSKEFLVHEGVFTKEERSGDLYTDLCSKFPHFTDDIDKMYIFDFITRQIDRHVNYSIKIDDKSVSSLYPLYDNGRSLFWNEDEIRIERTIKNIRISDIVERIAKYKKISNIVNLNFNQRELVDILSRSGFTGYKLDGCVKWINSTIDILKNI
ncbi:MAG: hypothetical protein FWF92_00250 [Oscillospiraceae bacterium]|nr:hypothetical protein [Oscillospiraceae bacterium]